jgi:Bacterial regulatory proteins, gntR family
MTGHRPDDTSYGALMTQPPDPRGRDTAPRPPGGYRVGDNLTVRPAQHAAEPDTPAPAPARRPRTWRSDEEKITIVEEWEAAPHGEKQAVLARHHVPASSVQNWASLHRRGMLAVTTRTGQRLAAYDGRPAFDARALLAPADAETARAGDIAADIERVIADGTLPAGARLLSQKKMRALFGVGERIMTKAVRLLCDRRLVELRGQGYFVTSPPDDQAG